MKKFLVIAYPQRQGKGIYIFPRFLPAAEFAGCPLPEDRPGQVVLGWADDVDEAIALLSEKFDKIKQCALDPPKPYECGIARQQTALWRVRPL